MGSVYYHAIFQKSNPSVGLLSIGEEENKGNELTYETHHLLKNSGLNYIGNIEGRDIPQGRADVIVCDGFVGNVALKTTEGLAQMISFFMKQEFRRNVLTRLAGLCAMPVLRAFRRRIDHRHYNGATLVGLNGIVIKSHGSADTLAFANAIDVALKESENQLPQRISRELMTLLRKKETA